MFGLTGIIVGFVMIVIGGALVFFFPSSGAYAPRGDPFTPFVVVVGLGMIIIGAIIIFT
jgi:hypothetical protein